MKAQNPIAAVWSWLSVCSVTPGVITWHTPVTVIRCALAIATPGVCPGPKPRRARRGWFWLAACLVVLPLSMVRAEVNSCIVSPLNGLRPAPFVHVEYFVSSSGATVLFDTATDANGCVSIQVEGNRVSVRVYAHNPVVKVEGTYASASLELRDGVQAILPPLEANAFRIAERARQAYNRGLREFSPWSSHFPLGDTDFVSGDFIGLGPDSAPSLPYTNPLGGSSGGPTIHLSEALQDFSTIAHELGHALHFIRLDPWKRIEVVEDFVLFFLDPSTGLTHDFNTPSTPQVAYIEAFGWFADLYARSPQDEAMTGPMRHAAFYEFVDASDPNGRLSFDGVTLQGLRDAGSTADRDGPVFGTLFVDFARHPAVGLDYVVETYIDCAVFTLDEYAICIAEREGWWSPIYQALAQAANTYGLSLAASPLPPYGFAFNPQADANFGAATASGDFNNDGIDDLAVGVPGRSVQGQPRAGVVRVFYGHPAGLDAHITLSQAGPEVVGKPEPNDRFGSAVAVGDFDGDGYDDLAVGVPGETIAGRQSAGAINIFYGSSRGLQTLGSQLFRQGRQGIAGAAEALDGFGGALAAGDFDGNTYDDLAVGSPGEAIGSVVDAGAVHIIYSLGGGGLTGSASRIWHQQNLGAGITATANNRFGTALAAGDINHDGRDDVAIGVPGENTSAQEDAGAVYVLYGPHYDEAGTSVEVWTQDTAGIAGSAEPNDQFGSAVAMGHFHNRTFVDVTIGVPGESIGSRSGAGAVQILHGTAAGLTAASNQLWHQNSSGIEGSAESRDAFGASLVVGYFNRDAFHDLAIGVPGEDIWATTQIFDAGAVNVIYGASGGLSSVGNQFWSQASVGVGARVEAFDRYGAALGAGDFDGDHRTDLFVGVPGESVGEVEAAGAVHLIRGDVDCLTADDNRFLSE